MRIRPESKRKEHERRLKALETHIQDLEARLTEIMYTHLTEFHPGQDAQLPRDETGAVTDPTAFGSETRSSE